MGHSILKNSCKPVACCETSRRQFDADRLKVSQRPKNEGDKLNKLSNF